MNKKRIDFKELILFVRIVPKVFKFLWKRMDCQ
jgi:hypothetical protein